MKVILYFILFLSTAISAQTNYSIIDISTQEPVPFVNIYVEGENAGTTADENGVFILSATNEDKVLIFSAIGFEELRVSYKNIQKEVLLTPTVLELEEVIIEGKKNNLTISIDKFKKSQTRHSLGNQGYPQMAGKFFPYKQEYENTPYINKIRILTRSEVDSATFNIRL